jgi:hypothetical protein
MRPRPLLLLCALCLVAVGILWFALSGVATQQPEDRQPAADEAAPRGAEPATQEDTDAASREPTEIYAHNLLLQQGPSIRVYIPWMRGLLVRRNPAVAPSLDLPDSFALEVTRGVLRVQANDLSRYLNSGTIPNVPFSDVSFAEENGLLVMRATIRELKILSIPVELTGTLAPGGTNLLAFQVAKIHVLKMPLGGLLHILDIKIGDVFDSHSSSITVRGNGVYFNTETLPPAPHIVGHMTSVHLAQDAKGLAVEVIYGHAGDDTKEEEQWRDFLKLTGGTLRFGRLTMNPVDLILIDEASKDPFFQLDLAHYQTQLVHGITRVTPEAGFQIFMPGLDQLPNAEPSATITREWLKDRDMPAPAAVPSH